MCDVAAWCDQRNEKWEMEFGRTEKKLKKRRGDGMFSSDLLLER